MQQILKRFRTPLLLCAAAALAFGAWFLYASDASPEAAEPLTAKSLMALLKKDGPKEAYAEFLAKNGTQIGRQQHLTAHRMGEVLYREYGTKGVVYCDSSFSFGCYHGFFGVALEEGGAASVPKLDAACVSMYGPWGTGCTHGIGHGILEFTGADRLNDALALCTQTTQLSPYLGCTSGVFMEYFTPLVGSSNGSLPTTRQLDEAHPYAPCTFVPKENQASCYFELGGWYKIIEHDYAKIGRFCDGLANAERTNCFLGVGALIPPTEGFDPNTALARCALFSGKDELSCRAGGYWGFYAEPTKRENAAVMCGYTDASLRSSCETLADLTLGQLHK